MNYLNLFQKFDKGNKYYLTKHELKLAFISNFGIKLRYNETIQIWKDRKEFNYINPEQKFLATKGISFEYFEYLFKHYENSLSIDQKNKNIFRAVDKKEKGYINLDDLIELCNEKKIYFANKTQLTEIFDLIDLDKDGKITFCDYNNFVIK